MQNVKQCDFCDERFFFSATCGFCIVAEPSDAYFCSPYCREKWIAEQFATIEAYLDEGFDTVEPEPLVEYDPLKHLIDELRRNSEMHEKLKAE